MIFENDCIQNLYYSQATSVKVKALRVLQVLERAACRPSFPIIVNAHCEIRSLPRPTTTIWLRRMASMALETDLRKLSLIETSYPQIKDVDNDLVKLSSAIFPSVEVRMQH